MSPFMGLRVSTKLFGGDERDRTADPLLAKQVLSQLSYTPRPVFSVLPSYRLFEPQKLNNDLIQGILSDFRLLTLKL